MRNRSLSLVAAALGLSVAGLVAVACSGSTEGSAAPRLGAGGDGGDGGASSAGKAGAAVGGSTSGGKAGTSSAGGKAGAGGVTGAGGATGGGAGGATGGGAAGATSGGAGGVTTGGAGGVTTGGAGGASAGNAGASAQAGSSGAGSSNDGGLTADTACAAVSFGATLVKRPIDIVLLIDNSGSMGNDIVGVQDNINQNFADILNASTIDWRLVLISKHGKASSGESICVNKPLSGHDCNPVPAKPINTSKFFHYSQEVASRDSLQLILSTYNKVDEFGLAPNGWQEWLRSDAFKVFLEITDDRSDLASATFQADLLKLVPARFGTPGNPDYVFHSIIGLEPNNPATAPWPSSAPIKTATCGAEAVNAGQQYQELSIATGGLRFPICDKTKFDAVFQSIAAGVISGAKISCDLPVPPNPPGQTIDSGTIEIEFSGTQPTKLLDQISGTAGCDDKSFYITNGQIHLCPNTCKDVQADPKAKLDLLVGCGKI